jgi:large subunit ribosomal protein L15
MRLNEIKDRPGSTHAKKRLGRGVGSGLGKTSGRGIKGQKARSGVAIKAYEGGQMPLDRRLPKRGFNNIFAKRYNEIGLGRVQAAVDTGKLDGKAQVTAAALKGAGVIKRVFDGVRLLGNGTLKAKLSFEIAGATAGAVKAVEAAGGSVAIVALPKAPAEAVAAKAKRRAKKSAQTDVAKDEDAGGAAAKKTGAAPRSRPKK